MSGQRSTDVDDRDGLDESESQLLDSVAAIRRACPVAHRT